MADSAYLLNSDGTKKLVFAKKLSAADSGKAYCCVTKKCTARMYGYSLGGHNARFNSYDINEHISSSCIGRELHFNDHLYDEDLFSLEEITADLENATVPQPRHNHTVHGKDPVNIDNRDRTALRTTGAIYSMCCHIGVDGTYNEIPINTFFACRDNYAEKSNGFTGLHVVEASFYKFIANSPIMIFNYTPYGLITNNPAHIRIVFRDVKAMYKFYRTHFADKQTHKLKSGVRKRLVVIMGVWRETDDPDCIAECDIVKLSQFKFMN